MPSIRAPSSPPARGFTLIELLIVIVILGLLLSLVAPTMFSKVSTSQRKTALAQMQMLATSLDTYRLDVGRYPSTEQGLTALNRQPDGEPKWHGPYLAKNVPVDPWGRAYLYRYPGEHGDYDVWTLGSDGVAGGQDADSDVGSW